LHRGADDVQVLVNLEEFLALDVEQEKFGSDVSEIGLGDVRGFPRHNGWKAQQ
jgi:hypothetical protein